MKKSSMVIGIIIVVNSLVTVVWAQSTGSSNLPAIDYANIFSSYYTYIGIPSKDSVYIYEPERSKSLSDWSLVTSMAIPEGTIAIDGNIGKNIFLSRERVIFEESGQYDTLHFNAALPAINPRLWIRTPHSTETDSYFLSGEKNVCYYREYDEAELRLKWHISDQLSPYMFKENRTEPVLTDQDGFDKLYSFITNGGIEYLAAVFKHRISFFRYPMVQDTLLRDKIIETAELNFPLPQGTITAFVYDYEYIAIVSREQIDFYSFNREEKKWLCTKGIPSFRFADQYNEK